jgi:hypothetical protein
VKTKIPIIGVLGENRLMRSLMTDGVLLSPHTFAQKRDHYIERLKPIFLPPDPISNYIIRYYASLLRVLGIEDRGWDPYAESRVVLDDINSFFKVELPPVHFKEPAGWRYRFGGISTHRACGD